jgi:hypothetical protein
MTMILDYPSKKVLKEQVGQPLKYIETSLSDLEYRKDGTLFGCNRPHVTGHKREFFAQVVLSDGIIQKVK